MMRIWLLENGGAFNRGCEAITRSTVDILREALPAARFVYWSTAARGDRVQYADIPGFAVRNDASRRQRLRVLRALYGRGGAARDMGRRILNVLPGRPDAVLALGGDNYSLDYGISEFRFRHGRMFTAAGIPFVIWAASIGPFSAEPEIERQMPTFLSSLALITVRETSTLAYLADLGVSHNVVRVCDPAFLLPAVDYRGPATPFLQRPGPLLGFNISALVGRHHPGGQQGMMEESGRFIRRAVADGYRVLLVPHVSGSGRPLVQNDHEFLRLMAQRAEIKNAEAVCLLEEGVAARQTKSVIARCSSFIGARTHATIAALSSGVPTLSIAYSVKARGINHDLFGHERYVLETPCLSAETLWEKFQQLQGDGAAIRSELAAKRPVWQEAARAAMARLGAIIRQRSNGDAGSDAPPEPRS